MPNHWTRRAFAGSAVTGAFLGLTPATASSHRKEEAQPSAASVHDTFPAQDPALVRQVVGASHGNIEVVRSLVEASPALAKASWDWGFGDWESAVGAAAHTGRRAIAEILLANGARPNIFSAAMMGHLDVVVAMIEAQPGLQSAWGPHGINLMRHARAGREHAAKVVTYLEQVGGADASYTNIPVSAEQRALFLGVYEWGDGDRESFTVTERDDMLWIERTGEARRGMFHHGNWVFHPAGAEAVRITFAMRDAHPEALTVHDPEPIVTAFKTA